MMFSRLIRIFLGITAVLVFLVIVVELRARGELSKARAAANASEADLAVKHYSRALIWYLPGGAAETAAEELLALGLSWADDKKSEKAVKALSRMRSGLYGARSFFIPRPDLIARAEPVLAKLRARMKLGSEADPADIARQAREYLSLMQSPAQPATIPAAATAGGFIVWVLGCIFFTFRFFQKESHRWSRAWPWAVVWTAGFILWIWGMKWA